MADIRALTLACTFAACVALLVFHALMARTWLVRNPDISPQKATALLGLVLNIPLAIAITIGAVLQHASTGSVLLALVYAALAFNCVAYSYFHVFNLSETGRRIRMLLHLLDGEQPGVSDDCSNMYSGRAMVSQRVGRLLQMGQIREAEGRYRIGGRFLLRAAKLVRFIGRLTTGRTGILPGEAP